MEIGTFLLGTIFGAVVLHYGKKYQRYCTKCGYNLTRWKEEDYCMKCGQKIKKVKR